ncbi:CynX/NimT family MFS transporter [Amnibacterium kyonggiense]|uniref:CP family cyanate transporter-like MFS transporter n=1 Tax=Amnibacterium kyonggiense TaxID=595671 RepID=A0A4R7FRQ7_9MICO|nr:MFS transporter [Amnibacterium kyonggiense]TDS80515.1 CP family cyanate transporter-like MFS transporter [Amnibacterium kyonggiense]
MTTAERGRLRVGLLLAGIVLLAFQLRSPLVALAPVAAEAQRGWAITPAAFGLLTTVPLLCFGLATPLAPWLARRIGLEGAIEVCIGGIVVATVLRSIDGFGVAIAAVVLLGLAITIGNVLVPAVIRRDVPPRGRAAATSVYSVAINVGTVITSVVTVPLAALLGWRAAVAAWSVAGVIAAAVWLVQLRLARSDARLAPPLAPAERMPFRPDLLAVVIAVTFTAQSVSYYGVTTWLPTLLADERGYSPAVAGSASAVFQLGGIAGAIVVPLLRLRFRPRTVIALIGVLWVSLPVVLLVAPEHFVLGSITGGIAQGGGFTAVFTIIAEVGGDARRTTALSAFVQTCSYLVAAAAPPVVGALHQLAGNWTAPMLLILGSTLVFLVGGVLAATFAARRT